MKKTRKQRAEAVDDDRVRKIAGTVVLSIAAYLFLAFVSYLFTWKVDQAAAMSYGWGLLFTPDVGVANWLGPLGAVSAHTAFYHGFGATSFLFVYLMVLTGLAILKRRPLIKLQRQLRWGLIGLMGLSIMLAFLFRMIDFPMGGAYGYLVSNWLERLIGIPGVVILFLLACVMLVIWMFDPTWSEITSGKLTERIELKPALPGGLGRFVSSGESGRPAASAKSSPPAARKSATPDGAPEVSRPQPRPEPRVGQALSLDDDDDFAAPPAPPRRSAPTAPAAPEGNHVRPGAAAPGDDLDMDVSYAVEDPALVPIAPAPPVPPHADAAPANAPAAEDGATAPAAPAQGQVPPDFTEAPGGQPRDVLAAEEELGEQGPYDPKLDLRDYRYPELTLLKKYPDSAHPVTREELQENKREIVQSLLNFSIQIDGISATVGPTITLYELIPAAGVRIAKIRNLSDDIALKLKALGIRIIAPIPGRGSIGVEVPNKHPQIVPLLDVLQSEKFQRAQMELPLALGKTIQNETLVVDLAKMPHLLVAGATGQGKSVGINTIIMSLLYKKHPSEVKLVMVDPKKVELSLYEKLQNHFLTYMPGQDETIITENKRVIHTLKSLTVEMDERYKLLKLAGARNLLEYNGKFVERRLSPKAGHKYLPYIVMIIDEFADLIMTAGKEVEAPIARIAQLARAVGMHLIIATQRPTVKIITGTIKANFPARLAFRVTSLVDSRTILDSGGAEQLIGKGDMLLSMGSSTVRVQCAFVDTPEVESVIDFVGDQQGLHMPYLLPEVADDDEEDAASAVALTPDAADEKLREAAHMVVDNCIGSTSMLQRRMSLGFNRAGRIMDQLCQLGVVGEGRGSKPREVMVRDIVELESMLDLFYGK